MLKQAREKAVSQIERTLTATSGCFPHYTEKGRWVTTEDGVWTGGLWVGQLWLAYQWTGNERYRDAALSLMRRLEKRIDAPDANFDLGFLLVPSFVRGYELLGEERLRQIALRGATRMLGFFHEKARLIYTVYPDKTARYGPVGTAIIDIMMNLSLLWWAYKQIRDSHYYKVALLHAERTAELHIRPDGSTFHNVDFDLETGKILHRGTIHGYSDESTWARGQAWALYGFAMAYRATNDPVFYEIAQSLSAYFFRRLPVDNQPYWDLTDPDIPNTIRDTSAAAIAAIGWRVMSGAWPATGERLVQALVCSTLVAGDSNGILSHATAYKTQGRGVEEATVWGDYFLLRNLEETEPSWIM